MYGASRLIGRKYGHLKVIEIDKYKPGKIRKAKCECKCGNKVTRSAAYLRSKTAYIKSCKSCMDTKKDDAVNDSDANINTEMQSFYLGRKIV